ncbi:uncharacterized protein [Panulirus ornatus]|uniref:uncharacterized protein isoform X2 n=1 Tax=Panulirus ornatus TaxID=150431 RepID=UPI003A87F927
MRGLVIVCVVLGTALGQGFPRDSPEVAAARDAFIREYNRLAELAALAPDIHIYHRDPPQPIPGQPAPPAYPAFNAFSFSANLGANEQFHPGPNTFPTAGHLAGHMAGHLAGHRAQPAAPQPSPHRFAASPDPTQRWTGPFADTVPAGVDGQNKHINLFPTFK